MKLNWFEKMMMNSPFRPPQQRKEALLMRQLGGDVAGGHVLEIGCGRGVGVEIILDVFHPSSLEAFDFDSDQVRLAKQRLESKYHHRVRMYEGSATEIPAPDDSFDAVFDFGVLHHIPNNDTALSEIARVLKPNGRFFFMEILSSITMNWVIRMLTYHPPEAQFTGEDLARKLAKSGLNVREDSYGVGLMRVIGVAWKDTCGIQAA